MTFDKHSHEQEKNGSKEVKEKSYSSVPPNLPGLEDCPVPPVLKGECFLDENEQCDKDSKLTGSALCYEGKCACNEGQIGRKYVDDHMSEDAQNKSQILKELFDMNVGLLIRAVEVVGLLQH